MNKIRSTIALDYIALEREHIPTEIKLAEMNDAIPSGTVPTAAEPVHPKPERSWPTPWVDIGRMLRIQVLQILHSLSVPAVEERNMSKRIFDQIGEMLDEGGGACVKTSAPSITTA